MFDTVVIGRGPAGMSAALYVLRAGFSTAVIAKDGGALEKAEKIENYYGFKSISGRELLKLGNEQIAALGGKTINDEVTGISYNGDYTVICANGEYKTRSLVIASGAVRNKVSIKGIEKFEGAGVSYCAVCDSFFYRGKTAAVIGSGNYAMHEAAELAKCSELYLLTNGEKSDPNLVFPENTKIITESITQLSGGERLESVIFADGNVIRIDGLFVAQGVAGGADFARTLGLRITEQGIVADNEMRTGIPGVFAAGDVTGGFYQISVAVGEGAKAGLSAVQYLRE